MLCGQVWAQNDSTLPVSDRYIYLYRTAGGKQVSHYYCYLEEGKQVLVVRKGGMVATMQLQKPNIFELVEKNQAQLLAGRKHAERPKNREAFLTDFRDYNKIVGQLGIKSSFMHFNHFTVKSNNYVAGIKDETTRQGLQLINQLIAVLDKAAQAVSEEQ